ncbi:MAG: hypothetical protein R2728_05285 [Chitinophagales bacterium]
MRYVFLVCLFFFSFSSIQAQTDLGDSENAVMIGNIDMNTVIIHVYKNKEDQWPYKEFSIVTNPETGEKEVVSSSIKGKVSKGGFIIVNGLKTVEEIQRMVSGDKVYDEILVNDVSEFEEYENIISNYLKESIIEDALQNDKPQIKETVTLDSLFSDGVFVGFGDNINIETSDNKSTITETVTQDSVYENGVLISINYVTDRKTSNTNTKNTNIVNPNIVLDSSQIQLDDYDTLEADEETNASINEEQTITKSEKDISSTISSKKNKKKKSPQFTVPKYKSKYGSRKSKKMS